MNHRENWLRAVEYRHPEWIPCQVSIYPLNWRAYREELEDLVIAHPRIFPDYQRPNEDFFDEMPVKYRTGVRYRDIWGCVWQTAEEGILGRVVEEPLSDWSAFETYRPPDPLTSTETGRPDLAALDQRVRERRAKGLVAKGGGGNLFDRLYMLRGFENLMMDIATDAPQLPALIELLEQVVMKRIKHWLEIGVDVVTFHTDIGTQAGLMISPSSFRKYLKPMFARLFQTCRQAGSHVFLSSDGNILEIVDDLLECGVSVHDPQLRACTLEGIVNAYKGRMCAQVDLDRQGFAFMTPAEIREQVKQVVDAVAAPEGGLIVYAEFSAGVTPLRNIAAMLEAMEDYCFP